MPKMTMFAKPNMSPDIAVPGLKALETPKGWSFKVDVDFDAKIFAKIEKDSILLKEMNEGAAKAYKQTCDAIKSKFTAFDNISTPKSRCYIACLVCPIRCKFC